MAKVEKVTANPAWFVPDGHASEGRLVAIDHPEHGRLWFLFQDRDFIAFANAAARQRADTPADALDEKPAAAHPYSH